MRPEQSAIGHFFSFSKGEGSNEFGWLVFNRILGHYLCSNGCTCLVYLYDRGELVSKGSVIDKV